MSKKIGVVSLVLGCSLVLALGGEAKTPWTRGAAELTSIGPLARTIHEDVLQTQQLGSWRRFAGSATQSTLIGSMRKPGSAKCRQGPRGRRSRPVAKSGVRIHE